MQPLNLIHDEALFGQTVSVNIDDQLTFISATIKVAIEDNDEDTKLFDDLMVIYMKLMRALAVVTAKLPDQVVELFKNNIAYISQQTGAVSSE